MNIEVPIRAIVTCDDGIAGRSEAVIVDPLDRRVTHFVLSERHRHDMQWLIPLDLVAWTTDDEIRLRCKRSTVRTQEPFVETQFVEAPWVAADYVVPAPFAPTYLWPFAFPQKKVPITHERVAKGELAMRRGAAVDAADGPLGKVEAFLVDADDDRITHVVVSSGLFVRREFAVPIADVARIDDGRVVLRLTHREAGELRRVPYQQFDELPGIRHEDTELVAEPPTAAVARHAPDASHVEATHLLAQEAEPRLRAKGFTDDEVLAWATAYVGDGGTGDMDEFVRWIDREKHVGGGVR